MQYLDFCCSFSWGFMKALQTEHMQLEKVWEVNDSCASFFQEVLIMFTEYSQYFRNYEHSMNVHYIIRDFSSILSIISNSLSTKFEQIGLHSVHVFKNFPCFRSIILGQILTFWWKSPCNHASFLTKTLFLHDFLHTQFHKSSSFCRLFKCSPQFCAPQIVQKSGYSAFCWKLTFFYPWAQTKNWKNLEHSDKLTELALACTL